MAKKNREIPQVDEWGDPVGTNRTDAPDGSSGASGSRDRTDDWDDTPRVSKPARKPNMKVITAIGCTALAVVLLFVFFGKDLFRPGEGPDVTAAPAARGRAGDPTAAPQTAAPLSDAPESPDGLAVTGAPVITADPAVTAPPAGTAAPAVTAVPVTADPAATAPAPAVTDVPAVSAPPAVIAVVTGDPGQQAAPGTPALNAALSIGSATAAPGMDTGVINCSWYGEEMRYFYHQLSPKEQSCFRVLYNGIMNFETEIPVESVGCSEGELERVMTVLMHDSPELFQLGNEWSFTTDGRKVISVKAKYRKSKEQYEEESDSIRDLLEDLLEDILDELKDEILDEIQDELEEAIYDWLMKKCRYGEDGDSTACADAALVYGTAQCSGYSKALSLLLRSAGIKCIEVPSVPDEDHQWNMVELDDDWYNCDPTWDDSYGDDEDDDDDDEVFCFCYLNVPDRRMTNHTADSQGFVYPACNSTEKTYARRKGIYIAPEDNVPDLAGYISEEIRRQWQEGKTSFLVMIDQDIPGLDIKEVCNSLDLPAGIRWQFVFPGKPETNSFYIKSKPGQAGAGAG